jgi:hypothetical protein
MTCKQLTVQEYRELTAKKPNAKSYKSEAECECLKCTGSGDCCAYTLRVDALGTTSSKGWLSKQEPPAYAGFGPPTSTYFEKIAECDDPPTEELTWTNSDTGKEQTVTVSLGTGGYCCEGKCATKCCTRCGESKGVTGSWYPSGDGGCVKLGCETDCANTWSCVCTSDLQFIDYRPDGPCPPP